MWKKDKLLVLSNFFFCHYVFKKSSAAGASKTSIWGKGIQNICLQVGKCLLPLYDIILVNQSHFDLLHDMSFGTNKKIFDCSHYIYTMYLCHWRTVCYICLYKDQLCGWQWCSGKVMASHTKSRQFEPCDERILPWGFFHSIGSISGYVSRKQTIQHDLKA